jgi:hypothetical protein
MVSSFVINLGSFQRRVPAAGISVPKGVLPRADLSVQLT